MWSLFLLRSAFLALVGIPAVEIAAAAAAGADRIISCRQIIALICRKILPVQCCADLCHRFFLLSFILIDLFRLVVPCLVLLVITLPC